MQKSESIKELAGALAKAQAEMVNPGMDKTNPHFRSKYASLASVRDAIVPTLAKHGIAVSQSLRGGEDGVQCETMLMHTSGEWLSDTLSLPVSKNDAQGYGSAITYARRYSLMSFAGVVGDEDDDGNAAAKAAPDRKAEKSASRAATVEANRAAEEEEAEFSRSILTPDQRSVAELLAQVVIGHWEAGDHDMAYTTWVGAQLDCHDQKTYAWSLLKKRSTLITTKLKNMNDQKKLKDAALHIASQA